MSHHGNILPTSSVNPLSIDGPSTVAPTAGLPTFPRDDTFIPSAPASHSCSIDDANQRAVESQSNQELNKNTPGQPLTTIQGKPRERVFVACVQCRTRKIRCDGATPECTNCIHRTRRSDSGPCIYDVNPRRRGKDRTPGSRKHAPFVPKKTRTTRSRYEEEEKRAKLLRKQTGQPVSSRSVPSSGNEIHQAPPFTASSSGVVLAGCDGPSATHKSFSAGSNHISSRRLEQQEDESRTPRISTSPPLDAVPSVNFIRETWWDALIALYVASSDRTHSISPHLTVGIRSTVSERILSDLRLLFRVSLLWFGFFNIPQFFSSLINLNERRNIQPSLILATLALSTLHQSSELEMGDKGMEKALKLIDQAYSAFHASLNSGRVDVELAQAAYVLAAFELQAHPKASPQRTREAMTTLDAIIRYLALTTLDVDNTRTTIFLPHAVPSVRSDAPALPTPGPTPNPLDTAISPFHDDTPPSSPRLPSASLEGVPPGFERCGCDAYSLGRQWPQARTFAPQFAQMPMWPSAANTGELHREECRRLVWASVILATGLYNTRLAVNAEWEPHHLWIKDPSNYALLFPGESLASSISETPSQTLATSKDSVWALYIRALLLWHGSQRARGDPQYAQDAWAETNKIEAALERHSCMVETGFCLKMREVLFNTRMCVSHEFRRRAPDPASALGLLLCRDKAEQWMVHQMHVAKYFAQCLRYPKTSIATHARRNFLVAWLISQVTRALALWEADSTLSIALDVARMFAPSAEYYMRLWSSPDQQRAYDRLYTRLVFACMATGMSPPPRTIPLGSAIRGAI
ncbi:hypothetical protein C8Q79DRAFT_916795 [Trametes meyenii]|nr:hypothetical protein C8Q79DRAFT_916795 [Trametes meyenii]